jgi:hypothetical protein
MNLPGSIVIAFIVCTICARGAEKDGRADRRSEPAWALKLFAEKPFGEKSAKLRESYRFVYWPTFSQPHLIRLDVSGDSSGSLLMKRLSGKGGYETGKIDLQKTKKVGGKTFKDLIGKLRDPKVHRPYGELSEDQVEILSGLDGVGWYLETVSAQGYNCTYSWCPKSTMEVIPEAVRMHGAAYKQVDLGAFISACETLLDAAGLQFDADVHGLIGKPANKAQK